MATIDLGKIKLVFRGTYNASTAYTPDDLVAFTDSGILSTYICTTATTGNAPSSGGTAHSSWAYLAQGGSGAVTTSGVQSVIDNNSIAPGTLDMDDNQKILLGTGDALELYHNGTDGIIDNTGDGNLKLLDAGSTKLEVTSSGVSVTGDMTASGNVTAYSDSRLKTDISTINDALGTVGKLRGVNYKWLRSGQSDIGVIAQEVESVVPEVVKTTEVAGLDGMEEVKSVDYGRLVGVLINAINELKTEVDELKGGK